MEKQTKPQFDKDTINYLLLLFDKLATKEMTEAAYYLNLIEEESDAESKEFFLEKLEESNFKVKHTYEIAEKFISEIQK